ncbi:RsmD family RNA methyltransferase [Chitinispirillales bacterium ANBcel5]|uniref:RsmD family RNA methyltransferase n=1 Tax=Cellulosispirillum alkaliphilum TaxID=3039283 RepID=UPI002A58A85D|nr:RsmD family RNA methyltransferase [Chitinispirillales bacterium ANBcel5]
MRLRIISGELKGRMLNVTLKDERFRPTLERTRESVSEILKKKITGAIVADMCAGSGAMGFEMLSRGASRVDFYEKDKKVADQIYKNGVQLGVEDRVRVYREDIQKLFSTSRRYSIIFYDPPYDNEILATLVPRMFEHLLESGILVYERRRLKGEKTAPAPQSKENLWDSRIYSSSVIEFYKI